MTAWPKRAGGNTPPTLRSATPWLAALTSFAIVLLAGQLATRVPSRWLGPLAAELPLLRAHFIDRFFAFDALWYHRIAADGYRWHAAQRQIQQDVAFFPLWPLLLAPFSLPDLTVTQTRWMETGLAAGFAMASILAFHRLAQLLLPQSAARTATFLYALYPAANFLLESYPTGLANLVTILALLALMDDRYLRAACWSGIVTASGPLGLGTALTVCTCAGLRSLGRIAGCRRLPELLALVGLGVLSVSGLLVFLAWQLMAVGDPFAFMKAQAAWEPQLPWAQRVAPAVLQVLVLPELVDALRGLKHVAHPSSLLWLQPTLQTSLYRVLQCVALLAISASRHLRCRPVLLQGVFTMALFIWFHSTSRPGNSTLRLLYGAIGMFLGLAWLVRDRPRAALAVIVLSGGLLAGGSALTLTGFYVT